MNLHSYYSHIYANQEETLNIRFTANEFSRTRWAQNQGGHCMISIDTMINTALPACLSACLPLFPPENVKFS